MSESTSRASSPGSAPAGAGPNGKPYIGGQAVLEGVMMRSPGSFAIVVRRRDGSLHVRERKMSGAKKGAARIPFLRGVASLVESLRLGSEALRFSTDQLEKDMIAAEREEENAKAAAQKKIESKAKSAAKAITNALSALGLSLFLLSTSDEAVSSGASKEDAKKRGGAAMAVTFAIMILFIWALPQGAAALVKRIFHLNVAMQSPEFQAITGFFKLVIVVGYLLLIRRVADIRRVFQYHGAEHKTISTYEAAEPLTVANARTKTTLHPRCGTTFLVMVVLVSIVVFIGLGGLLPKIDTGNGALDQVVFFIAKLPFIPVIAGLTFEIQRIFARYCTKGPLRALLWPGFLVQKITTIEPDDEQLEVALASLRATLLREEGVAGTSTDDVRFKTYEALLAAPALRAAS